MFTPKARSQAHLDPLGANKFKLNLKHTTQALDIKEIKIYNFLIT